MNFDAVSNSALLWEVKTHNYANCRSRFCQAVLWNMWVAQAKSQLTTGLLSATYCGYALAFGAGDAKLLSDVGTIPLVTTVFRPDICLKPTAP